MVPLTIADITRGTGHFNLTQGMIDEKPPNDGHRKNILSKSFKRIGISVIRDAKGTVWMTHDFAG